MKAFQRKIYKHLVEQGTPEAIAELLASRCTHEVYGASDTVCICGFGWGFQGKSEETATFWSSFHDALEAEVEYLKKGS